MIECWSLVFSFPITCTHTHACTHTHTHTHTHTKQKNNNNVHTHTHACTQTHTHTHTNTHTHTHTNNKQTGMRRLGDSVAPSPILKPARRSPFPSPSLTRTSDHSHRDSWDTHNTLCPPGSVSPSHTPLSVTHTSPDIERTSGDKSSASQQQQQEASEGTNSQTHNHCQKNDVGDVI